MISLSEFLTTSLNGQNGNNLLPSLLREQIKKALEAYKQHLINDNPKTIEWKNIEKQLVIALERMEAPGNKSINCSSGRSTTTDEYKMGNNEAAKFLSQD